MNEIYKSTYDDTLYLKYPNGEWMILQSGVWRNCDKPNINMYKVTKRQEEEILKSYPV